LDSQNFRLIIIGQGPGEKYLQKQVRALVDKGFEIWYYKEHIVKEKMFDCINAMDYMLFPSQVINGYTEGIPVTAFESITCRKPILALKNGGLRELFWQFKPGYSFHTVQEMVNGLTKLAKPDSSEYKNYQTQCQNHRMKFTKSNYLKKVTMKIEQKIEKQ